MVISVKVIKIYIDYLLIISKKKFVLFVQEDKIQTWLHTQLINDKLKYEMKNESLSVLVSLILFQFFKQKLQ